MTLLGKVLDREGLVVGRLKVALVTNRRSGSPHVGLVEYLLVALSRWEWGQPE